MKKLLLLVFLSITFILSGCDTQDTPAYINLFIDSCKIDKSSSSCEDVARFYIETKDITEKDILKAKEYYSLACEYERSSIYGREYICEKVKKIDARTKILTDDKYKCENNKNARACYSVGSVYEYKFDSTIRAVNKDSGKAKEYYSLGCEYGDSESCKKVDEIAEIEYDEYKNWMLYLLLGLSGVSLFGLALFGANKEIEKEIEYNETKKRNLLQTKRDIYNRYHFKETKIIWSDNKNSFISLDENSHQICFLHTTTLGKIFTYVYNFKDIMKSEIVEDGNTTVETSRGSQVVGAAIGGVLLGSAGLIVGGLSGKKTQINKIDEIDLVITVSDINHPIHVLHILQNNSDSEYKIKFELARKWQSIISILIKKVDDDDIEREASKRKRTIASQAFTNEVLKPKTLREEKSTIKAKNDTNNNLYVADEIRKLKALKDEGIISDEEFSTKKNQLLA